MALQLDPLGHAMSVSIINKIKVETRNPSQWIKGIHLDPKTEMLSVWSNTDINFFSLATDTHPNQTVK